MAYTFPASGGLKLTANGKTVGVFMADTGVLGPILLVAELADGQWLGRWTHGPWQTDAWEGKIAESGGDVAYLRTLLAQISAAIVKIFGGGGTVPTNIVDRVNQSLAEHFSISTSGVTEKTG